MEETGLMEQGCVKRIHRVGTLTAGCMMIVFGALFLLHLALPKLSYLVIFRLWPVIFIFLGIEVLLGMRRENVQFLYDKGAVLLMMLLSGFAMCMAFADWVFSHSEQYIYF